MGKKLIGVLIPFLDQYYQRDLWQSIQRESEARGYKIIFFCGSVLDAPNHSEKYRNVIYRLPNPDQLSGLIIISGTLTNYCGAKRLQEWLKPYQHIPTVHVSLELEGSHCILVDNYKSMFGLMEHVMTFHKYKKVAFISGPKTNSEAIERRRAFVDMMNQSIHKIDAYNVYEGDFSKESAIEAVKQMKTQGFEPDIVICANDEMAIGIHTAIYDMHLHLSDNTAFTGFDDIDNATIFSPDFTTVRQPFMDMGAGALEMLDHIICGRETPMHVYFSGQTIVRTSCGCMPFQREKGQVHQDQPMLLPGKTRSSIYLALKDYLIWVVNNEEACTKEIRPYVETLADELMLTVPSGSFVYKCFKAQNSGVIFDGDDILSCMDKLYNQVIRTGLVLPHEFYEIFMNLRLLAVQEEIRAERADNYNFMTMYYYSAELVEAMMTVKNISEMVDILIPYIETYHVDGLFICLYKESITCNESDQFLVPEDINMVCGYLNHKRLTPYTFKSAQMVPNEVLESDDGDNFVIYPLLFKENHFGYIASNTNNASYTILRTIIQQISTTLERISLQSKLEAYNQKLSKISESDPLTGVLNRRGISRYMDASIQEKPARQYGIIYCDVDRLKRINDLYGHSVGDEAILAVSDILKHVVEGIGQVSRLGGDEFMLVIEDADLDGLNHIVHRINIGVEAFNNVKDAVFELGITTGSSVWETEGTESFEMVIEYADRIMYDNKKKKNHQINE